MSLNHTTAPITVAVIVGSTREGRRGRQLADWAVARIAARSDVGVDVIDLVTFDLPARYTMAPDPAVTELRDRVEAADAFVVITPEYNHSYPASLKHAIDFVKDPWKRKPVAFVSYGGVSGGLRAVEHLRGVFNELHAHAIRDTVSFHGPWNGFADDGRPVDEPGARMAIDLVVDDLVWWATALGAARASVAP